MSQYIIQKSDFTNYYSLAKSISTDPKLQDYIDRYTYTYLYRLLGKTLADIFVADLDLSGVPTTPIYQKLYEAWFELDDEETYQSKGMKDLFLAMVFYHYVADTQSNHSQSGVASSLAEAGYISDYHNALRFAEKKFNEAINTWEAIQRYARLNDTIYPDMKGEDLTPQYSAFL